MAVFNLLLGIFTVVLYSYLFLLRKELVFVAKRKSNQSFIWPVFSALFIILFYMKVDDWQEVMRGGLVVLVVLSYLFNNRGLAENRIVIHSMDNRGVKYSEIDRVVIFHDSENQVLKVNFFRLGLRLPLFIFTQSLEELLPFLSKRLKKGTTIDIILNQP